MQESVSNRIGANGQALLTMSLTCVLGALSAAICIYLHVETEQHCSKKMILSSRDGRHNQLMTLESI